MQQRGLHEELESLFSVDSTVIRSTTSEAGNSSTVFQTAPISKKFLRGSRKGRPLAELIPEDVTQPVTIKISDLNRESSAVDLAENFRQFGKLQSVRVLHSEKLWKSEGVAIVSFESFPVELFDEQNELARKALSFGGRRLKVQIISERAVEKVEQERFKPREADAKFGFAYADESFAIDTVEFGSFLKRNSLFLPHVLDGTSFIDCFVVLHQESRKVVLCLKGQDGVPYKIEFLFSSLRNYTVMEMDDLGETFHLVIDVKFPPRIFKGKEGKVEEYSMFQFEKKDGLIWSRATKISHCPEWDFADHSVFRFKLSQREVYSLEFESKWNKLSQIFSSPERGALYEIQPFRLCKYLPCVYVDLFRIQSFPFDLQYAALSLVTSGLLKKYFVTEAFCRTLRAAPRARALLALEHMHSYKQCIDNPVNEFKRVMGRLPDVKSSRSLPNHCTSIRKIIVTPTKLIFSPPTIELGNRVVRKYHDYVDRFVRISFQDENFTRYMDGFKVEADVADRIKNLLYDGIKVGSRHFQFLAFSSSQLRDHSCWFFAPYTKEDAKRDGNHLKPLSCDDIRSWMGNFDHITSVAKYAARLGQCFSSTTPIDVTGFRVDEIPDVQRNGFCFSDGCGRMSKALASKIATDMNLLEVPTAFQVRMAGYKGVLCVDPRIQEEDNDASIQFRPSMKKFVTDHGAFLELIKPSQYAPAFLNHQIITLLNSMGVEDKVFLSFQKNMEEKLDAIFDSGGKACQLIDSFAGESLVFPILQKMISAGVSLVKEPFLNNMLTLFQCHKLKEVKYKARILCDQGAQLTGVLDEFGLLNYGQVFVQIVDPVTKKRYVPKGSVLVSKMPAVHPGDVRTLECVDYPELKDYLNVIVFPQKGHRPHPSETSGSDLDGDIYFVTWEYTLIPPVRNFQAMNFDPPEKPLPVKDINIDDVKNFMVDYIQNDQLGMIATSHKIHADLSTVGVMSTTCIELAYLHSVSVDFPKSGIPPDYDPRRYSVTVFPDFLNKKMKASYPSRKALGKLFREAKTMKYTPIFDVATDQNFVVDGYEEYIDEAAEQKEIYDLQIRRLMKQHQIYSEFELVSQLNLEFHKLNSRKEFEAKKIINDVLKTMRNQYRQDFWKNIGRKRKDSEIWDPVMNEQALRKAAAYYVVAYSDRYQTNSRRPMYSFPWMIVSDVLLHIFKLRNAGAALVSKNIEKLKLEDPKPNIVSEKLAFMKGEKLMNGDQPECGWVISTLDDLMDDLKKGFSDELDGDVS
jgi:RNA-dependent RNA polymerase